VGGKCVSDIPLSPGCTHHESIAHDACVERMPGYFFSSTAERDTPISGAKDGLLASRSPHAWWLGKGSSQACKRELGTGQAAASETPGRLPWFLGRRVKARKVGRLAS
jgi:hypothetical protein